MAEIKNITGEKLKKSHGADAGRIWEEILAIGGFGEVGFASTGGVDISGLPEVNRDQINKLLEVSEPVEAAKTKKDGK